jgi:hypothetical protein
MKLKKINATLSLLAIMFLMLHIGYSVFAYITFYYNPVLTKAFAIPFMVLTCFHAICGMSIVFFQADGTRLDLYPKQNMRTILQRVSAALIFPLLILHINTFQLLQYSAGKRNNLLFGLLIFMEVLFFATVITHVAVSVTAALITLGILASRNKQIIIDRVIYIIGAIAFSVAVIAVVKTQMAMFIR